MKVFFDVVKTECWPAQWYGGPVFVGQKMSNATCYYWRSFDSAKKYCNEQNDHLNHLLIGREGDHEIL